VRSEKRGAKGEERSDEWKSVRYVDWWWWHVAYVAHLVETGNGVVLQLNEVFGGVVVGKVRG